MSYNFREWYRTPTVQVVMIALTCFCCPGLFNALSGVGGGGQVNATAADDGSVALYSTFAVTSFFSGTINNRLGSRLTLSLGGLGYAFYIASFLSYNINQNGNFVIAAGAILGMSAGLLWTAQGSLVLAYATETSKGRLLALFWGIFNLGAVLGSAIELGLTYNAGKANTVSNTVYAVFMVLSFCGALIPILLIDPASMIRSDGSQVLLPVNPSWKSELVGMWKIFRLNYWIVLMFPYFFVSNFYYTYQFNDYNGALFSLRTRSLNSLLYWLFQVFGVALFGFAIDTQFLRRRSRAWMGLGFIFLLSMSMWAGTFSIQRGYTRESIGVIERIDFLDRGYDRYLILYIFMGVQDAIWQNFAYWLMGSFSNSSSHLAYYVGFYKAIQSVGAVIAFRMDSTLVSYMNTVIIDWSLAFAGLLLLLPVVVFKVTDHTIDERLVEEKQEDVEAKTEEEIEKTDDVSV